MNRTSRRLGTIVLMAALAACGDDKKDDVMGDNTGGDNTGGKNDTNNTGDDNTGGGNDPANTGNSGDASIEPTCPALKDRESVTVTGDITKDTTWTCDNVYLLDGRVYVKGATLKLEPGVIVQGATSSALFITSTAKIDAVGTKVDPIVFTSFEDEGSRKPSDWQGLVLLGKAKVNRTGGSSLFEGLDDLPEHRYGGNDDEHNCGTLQYVRIEWAGYEILPTKEVNGLTLGGCGKETELDYIQIHGSADDAIEFFGGSASIKHLVSSSYDDDGLDWDEGWSGNAQFVVLQQPKMPSEEDPNGFESDNQKDDNGATPISNPTVYNATIVGGDNSASFGMVLRRGTQGTIKNFIIQGFKAGAIDVRDSLTATHATDGDLTLESGLLFECGASGTTFYQTEAGADDDDAGFDEEDFFGKKDVVAGDPKLGDATSRTAPDFVPAKDSPAKDGAATPTGAWFDKTATYKGAFEPGGEDWTAGWTSFPAN